MENRPNLGVFRRCNFPKFRVGVGAFSIFCREIPFKKRASPTLSEFLRGWYNIGWVSGVLDIRGGFIRAKGVLFVVGVGLWLIIWYFICLGADLAVIRFN